MTYRVLYIIYKGSSRQLRNQIQAVHVQYLYLLGHDPLEFLVHTCYLLLSWVSIAQFSVFVWSFGLVPFGLGTEEVATEKHEPVYLDPQAVLDPGRHLFSLQNVRGLLHAHQPHPQHLPHRRQPHPPSYEATHPKTTPNLRRSPIIITSP